MSNVLANNGVCASFPWHSFSCELAVFRKWHGHSNVPATYAPSPDLAKWVKMLRSRPDVLSADQLRELVEKGFDFGRYFNPWLEKFLALARYRQKYGHCRMLRSKHADKEIQRLGSWAEVQRQKRDRLSLSQQRLLDGLGFDWDPIETLWQQRYEELAEFKRQHGHCDVPQQSSDNPALGVWVAKHRVLQRKGELQPERLEKLDALGFEWAACGMMWERRRQELTAYIKEHGVEGVSRLFSRNLNLYKWLIRTRRQADRLTPEQRKLFVELGVSLERNQLPTFAERLAQLSQFKRRHGHCDVTKKDDPELAEWLCGQRRRFQRGLMPPARRQSLEGMGVVLNPLETLWEEQFEALRRFRQQHGHCVVGIHNTPNKRLLEWVQMQKLFWSRGRLREDRRQRLEELGFVWNVKEAAWENYFRQLAEFRRKHGHCAVLKRHGTDANFLKWVERHRSAFRKGELPAERQRRLAALGFVGDEEEAGWDARMADLRKFRRRYGTFRISTSLRKYNGLRQWLDKQRRKWLKGTMPVRLKAKFEAIGFSPAKNFAPAMKWNWLERLRRFKQEHGHCVVTKENDPALAKWLIGQRSRLHAGRMTEARRHVLEKLGVDFAPAETVWEEQYQALRRFWREHGHCDVNHANTPNPRLLQWVKIQRVFRSKNSLRDDRRQRLEQLGFIWNTNDASWERNFQKFAEFQKQHGHGNVLLHNTSDQKLWQWTHAQKTALSRGKLSVERQRRLDELGFVWDAEEAFWDKRVAALQAFKRQYGTFDIPSDLAEYRILRAWTVNQRQYWRTGCLQPKLKIKLEAIGFLKNDG
ncbi:MAG: helicase associated domain-containing protein [Verrucomicrobiae bacterium]|nr:helicase associated domain-containing protein [Verrucomicrobiae bacterium]